MLVDKSEKTEFLKLQSLAKQKETLQTQRTAKLNNKIRNLQKKVILKFQNTNKVLKKNHQTQDKFRSITRQLKRTNNYLNIKKFKKSNPKLDVKKFQKDSNISIFCLDKQKPRQKKNILKFLQNKWKQNFYLKNKMKLFGNTISEHQKILLQKDLKYQTNKLLYSNKTNQQISQKYLRNIQKQCRYIISHMILQKFFYIISQNPESIQLKNQYSDIYIKLKEQMISIILDEEKIYKNLITFENYMEQRIKSKYQMNGKKLLEIIKTRKPFYLKNQRKKDEVIEQIQNLLQTIKNFIMNSLIQFNCPKIAEQFEQRWNRKM